MVSGGGSWWLAVEGHGAGQGVHREMAQHGWEAGTQLWTERGRESLKGFIL